jgi:hypothetical protein
MNKTAIERSEDSLIKAKSALQSIEGAQNFKQFEGAWTDFLLATGRIFTQLEAGAKGTPKSFGWFSAKKGQRRSDPLLHYMWHARNAEEHGLERVTTREPGGLLITGDAELTGVINAGPNHNQTSLMVKSIGETPPRVKLQGAHPKLAAVKERNGGLISPPAQHMGTELSDDSPVAVARLYASHIETMLNEARV